MARSGDLEKVIVLNNTKYRSLSKTGLSHRRLLKEVDKISSAKKLMIFATCHSGIGKSKLPPEVQELLATSKGTVQPIDDVSEGFIILSASTKGETAREDDRLRADIYTHFFLQGLQVNDHSDVRLAQKW